MSSDPHQPQLSGLTCEGRPHGEIMVVYAQKVAGLHLSGFGSIRNLLRQRTDDRQTDGQREVFKATEFDLKGKSSVIPPHPNPVLLLTDCIKGLKRFLLLSISRD